MTATDEQKKSNQSIGEGEKHYDAANKIHGITDKRDKKVVTAI